MPADITEAHHAIPWAKVIGMRHILVHHYFGIDMDIVWEVVEQYLPALKAVISKMLG